MSSRSTPVPESICPACNRRQLYMNNYEAVYADIVYTALFLYAQTDVAATM
jgi:hypothetical protein